MAPLFGALFTTRHPLNHPQSPTRTNTNVVVSPKNNKHYYHDNHQPTPPRTPSSITTPRNHDHSHNNQNHNTPINRFTLNTTLRDERDEKLSSISRHLRELSSKSPSSLADQNDAASLYGGGVDNRGSVVAVASTGNKITLSPRRPRRSCNNNNHHQKKTHDFHSKSGEGKGPPSIPCIEIYDCNHSNSNNNLNSKNNTMMEGMNLLHSLMMLEMQKYNDDEDTINFSLEENEMYNYLKSSSTRTTTTTTTTTRQSLQQRLDTLLQDHHHHPPPEFVHHRNHYNNNDYFNFASFYKTCAALLSKLQKLSNQNYTLQQHDQTIQQGQCQSEYCHTTEVKSLLKKNLDLQQRNEQLEEKVEVLRRRIVDDRLSLEKEMDDMRREMRRLYEERMYALMLFHEGVLRGEMVEQKRRDGGGGEGRGALSKRRDFGNNDDDDDDMFSTSLPTPPPTSIMSSLVWLVERDPKIDPKMQEDQDTSKVVEKEKRKASSDDASLKPSSAPFPIPQQSSSSSASLINTSEATVTYSCNSDTNNLTTRPERKGILELSCAFEDDNNEYCSDEQHDGNDTTTKKETKVNDEQEDKEDTIVIVPRTKGSGVKLVCIPNGDTDGCTQENNSNGDDGTSKNIFLVYAIKDTFDKSLNEKAPPIGSKLTSINSTPICTLKNLRSVKDLKEKIKSIQKVGNDVMLTFRTIAVGEELKTAEQRDLFYESCKSFDKSMEGKNEKEGQSGPKAAPLTPVKNNLSFATATTTLQISAIDEENKESDDIVGTTLPKKKKRPSLSKLSKSSGPWPSLSSSSQSPTSSSTSSAAAQTKVTSSTLCDDDVSCTSTVSSNSSCLSLLLNPKEAKVTTAAWNASSCEMAGKDVAMFPDNSFEGKQQDKQKEKRPVLTTALMTINPSRISF